MLNHQMLRGTAAAISTAVASAIGDDLATSRQRLHMDLAHSVRRRKGARDRSILSSRVEDGVLHTFHATKGPRKRRIASPALRPG